MLVIVPPGETVVGGDGIGGGGGAVPTVKLNVALGTLYPTLLIATTNHWYAVPLPTRAFVGVTPQVPDAAAQFVAVAGYSVSTTMPVGPRTVTRYPVAPI